MCECLCYLLQLNGMFDEKSCRVILCYRCCSTASVDVMFLSVNGYLFTWLFFCWFCSLIIGCVVAPTIYLSDFNSNSTYVHLLVLFGWEIYTYWLYRSLIRYICSLALFVVVCLLIATVLLFLRWISLLMSFYWYSFINC